MDATTLAAHWASIESAVEEHARFPPGALRVSWDLVAGGKIQRLKRPVGVMAVGVLPVRLEAAWLAVTDDEPVDRVKGLTQFPLQGAWASEKWLYQLLDLPWPVADRHWVLHSTNRAIPASARTWERAWTLADEWLPRARERAGAGWDEALTVPVNEGSWLLTELDTSNTLGVYQARASLGGSVPEEAAEAYSAATLPEMYAATLRDAQSMTRRYAAPCAPQPGADGRPLPCFPG